MKFIDGYPGKYVVLARRSGDKWYIAGINAQDAPVEVAIQLPEGMPKEGLTLYQDNDRLEGSVKSIKADKKGKVKVKIPKNGGVVINS